MSLKHMILGCLMDSPSYGYEIKKFSKDFFRRSQGVNEGQLYATLRKIEEEGLISKEVVYQDKNPPRNVYHLADKGRDEFYSWLLSEDDGNDSTSFDFFQVFPFLQRCNYFKHLPDNEKNGIVDKQIEKEMKRLQEFRVVRVNMLERDVHHTRLKIIEFGIAFQEMKINWLDNLKEQ